MREISLHEADDKLPVDTVLVYGDTGTGKTTFTAGWPRPLILADESEGGWKSLRGLTEDQLFEPGVEPKVWGIREMNDISQALERIPALIASGQVMTVGISSITFYSNTYLAHLVAQNKDADNRQLYGSLSAHLRAIRTRFHSLGINVVWEALAAHPEDGSDGRAAKKGRPLIAGQQADQFAAGVTYLFRSTMDNVMKEGRIVDRILRLHTQDSGGYLSRARIGKGGTQLPNPLQGGYQGLLRALGYDVERLRKTLPPLKAAVSLPTVVQPAAVKPPPTSKPIPPKAPPSAAETQSTK